MTNIDLSPVIQPLVLIAGVVLAYYARLAISLFIKKTGIQIDAETTAAIDDAANKSISYAVMSAQSEIAVKGYDHVDVQNKLIADGANRLIAAFPKVLAHRGLDPATAAGRQEITNIITRALPGGVAAAAASPTTPPVKNAAPIAVVAQPASAAAQS